MIFVDMDGTLAKFFEKTDCLERMYEKGYFYNLKPYDIVNDINKLIAEGEDVYILSACIDSPYCKEEKIAWIHTYLPELEDENIILCEVGENKADKISVVVGENRIKYCQENNYPIILIDDYSENLYNWEMKAKNFVAIKYCNEINDKTNKSYKYKFHTAKQLHKVLHNIYNERHIVKINT